MNEQSPPNSEKEALHELTAKERAVAFVKGMVGSAGLALKTAGLATETLAVTQENLSPLQRVGMYAGGLGMTGVGEAVHLLQSGEMQFLIEIAKQENILEAIKVYFSDVKDATDDGKFADYGRKFKGFNHVIALGAVGLKINSFSNPNISHFTRIISSRMISLSGIRAAGMAIGTLLHAFSIFQGALSKDSTSEADIVKPRKQLLFWREKRDQDAMNRTKRDNKKLINQ